MASDPPTDTPRTGEPTTPASELPAIGTNRRRNARAGERVTEVADVLTVDEAAQLLRIGRNQLYDAIGRNELPHRRIGRSIRLSRSVLLRWLGRSPDPC